MFSAYGVALLLAATSVKVAVPGFTVVGIDSAVVDAYTDHFVTLLGRDGSLKLTTQKDIAQVLGLERQRQLLGCGETQISCLAELAGALGVDAVLSVSLAKTGASFTATLRVLRANDGSEIASSTARLKSDDALQDWLEGQAPQLAARVAKAFERPSVEGHRTPMVRWVPAIGGAMLAIGGGVLFGLSRGSADQLANGRIDSQATAHSIASTGRTLEGAGAALMILGGAAVAASAAWVFVVPTGDVQVALAPTRGGGAAMVGGTF